jgi:tetratricopeptide (TPR) repeat protein
VHDAYLKGRFYLAKETPESLSRALGYFQDAIDLDATYAPAHAGVADCYNMMSFYGILIAVDAYPRAKQAALAAIQLDPMLGEAHVPLGFVYSQFEWDWPRAEAEFRRAIELNPSFDMAREHYALHLATQGRLDEALAQTRERLRLNPLSMSAWEENGWLHYFARQYGDAITEYKHAIEINPDDAPMLEGLGDVYAAAGRNGEAVAQYDAWAAAAGLSGQKRKELTTAYAQRGMPGYWNERLKMELAESAESGDYWSFRIATYYARLGEPDKTFEWLDKAYEERNNRLTLLNVNPAFDNVRADPRFAALIRKVGLPVTGKA